MTNIFAYNTQKMIDRHKDNDEEVRLICKDIDNAKQGVMSFSKEVKKYMMQFIHKRYDNNEEVMAIMDLLKNMSKYESYAQFEIFKVQEECYMWYDFLNAYVVWKMIGKYHGFEDENQSLRILVRLAKLDETVFKEYPDV